MWYNYFDKIYLVNLPERRDRYLISMWELAKFSIPYHHFKAMKHWDGKEGLYQTMRTLFEQAVALNYRRILVFEDDLKIIGPMDTVMEKCIQQLPEEWDMLYLGCNLARRPGNFFSANLLPVTRALSTHAVAYSRACMERILSLPKALPIDLFYAEVIQPAGKCYCTCPMLVTQYPGFSDIEKRVMNWSFALDERFESVVKPLVEQCHEAFCCIA